MILFAPFAGHYLPLAAVTTGTPYITKNAVVSSLTALSRPYQVPHWLLPRRLPSSIVCRQVDLRSSHDTISSAVGLARYQKPGAWTAHEVNAAGTSLEKGRGALSATRNSSHAGCGLSPKIPRASYLAGVAPPASLPHVPGYMIGGKLRSQRARSPVFPLGRLRRASPGRDGWSHGSVRARLLRAVYYSSACFTHAKAPLPVASAMTRRMCAPLRGGGFEGVEAGVEILASVPEIVVPRPIRSSFPAPGSYLGPGIGRSLLLLLLLRLFPPSFFFFPFFFVLFSFSSFLFFLFFSSFFVLFSSSF